MSINSVNIIIGIIMILSFFGMIWYCVKGYNLMIGFFVMAVFWTGLALVGKIRKTVELGGDKPGVTMTLLCVTTSVIFTTMTGIGPVISIAVIIIPILLSLGLPANITLFAFMGSIMSGIFANVVNFNQYQAMFVAANSGL